MRTKQNKKAAKAIRMATERVKAFESLESRRLFAVTASFIAGSGTLSVLGDNQNNTITLSRNAAGNILVNGGAVNITGGTATVANTALMQVFGQGGNDTITLSEANGALPVAHLFGGVGNDTLIGGAGGDQIFGQAGNDVLQGKGGFDFLFGGSENDVLTGGDDDDQVFGESGNDRMIWNPGDDTDLNEGGAGNDTTEVNGGNAAEIFTLTANGTRVRFDRLDPAPFSIDIGTTEDLVLNANGGNDSFSATGNLAALIKLTADGGTGNDTLLGTNGIDSLVGGDGNDFIDGQQGNDTALMGAGDDVFQWDPGDGNDVVEGQDGADRMIFNGSGGDESFTASANGSRVRFTRSLGSIVMDLNGVEAIDLNALGGVDSLTVNDTSGTNLVVLNANLAAAVGSTVGDGAGDTVIVNGTNGNDIIDVVGAGTSVSVLGLHTQVSIAGAEGANDALVVKGLGGNDGITATTLPAGVIKLTIDGGAGDDTELGSQGDDAFIGGDGNDFVFGDDGDDLAQMGAGHDVFQWNPGDDNDVIEGGDGGDDQMLFFGANIDEKIDVSANGGRVRFARDVATVVMDLNDVENINFRALGGVDNITVNDLSGTDLTRFDADLRGPNGGGDGAADTLTVFGTNGDDAFGAAGDIGGVSVFGLHTLVNAFFPEVANDRLTLNALNGDDVINASSLEDDGMQLTENGGLGKDILIGSEGGDIINGGDDDDTALMGAGDDTFVWNPGDDNDAIEGEAGFDTMLFNGAVIAEQVTVSAVGGHVQFTRDVANVVMDLNDTESIDFNALGGADKVTVNDLTGTDLTEMNVALASTIGGNAGDAAVDSIIVNGTSGDDVIQLVGDAAGFSVLGLAAQVNVTTFEPANDRITVNALAGDDVIEASGLTLGTEQNGGDGADILVGGDGNDVIIGGAGDDVLIGGPGTDILDGGDGDDVEIQG